MMSSSASPQARVSKTLRQFSTATAIVAFFMLSLASVMAQESANIGVLVVDMQKAQRDGAASLSVTEQIATLRSELESIISERSKEISREEAELAEERRQLTASELRARAREFEKKVFAHRDFEQREAAKLQLIQAQARAAIRGQIIPILADVLREQNAQIMLDKSQVVLSKETLDVTDEVIARLNEAMPTMVLTPLREPE